MTLIEKYNNILNNINHHSKDAILIVVSKTFSISYIKPIIDWGHIHYGENRVQESIEKLIEKLDIRYPSLKQDPSIELQLGDIRGLPATFVFNPKGLLSMTLYGGQTVESLKEMLFKLILLLFSIFYLSYDMPF